MKDKISTFKAMDILNGALFWINFNVESIENHFKYLKGLPEKFEIEKDFEETDAEFLIKEYLFILDLFIHRTKEVSKIVDKYLNGRGTSNVNITNWQRTLSNDDNSENE